MKSPVGIFLLLGNINYDLFKIKKVIGAYKDLWNTDKLKVKFSIHNPIMQTIIVALGILHIRFDFIKILLYYKGIILRKNKD